MRGRVFRYFAVPALLILSSLTGPFQLKKQDVRLTMDDMLALHVEYKEFSSFIARRSLKVYVEHFDPERVYLLSSEARPYVDPKEETLKRVVQNYSKDDLSEFEAMNQIFQKAIVRSRALRAEIEAELVQSNEEPQFSTDMYADYSSDETELKARLKKQLLRVLAIEKRTGGMREWNAEQRRKVFAMWEKRFARSENTYLAVNSEGKKLSTEHYLSLHVLKAMAKGLDAHTSYFSPEEAFEMRTSLEKQFEGIGVVLRETIEGVVIYDMIKGGPAERSGKIKSGDLLVEVDGQSLSGVSYEEVLKRLQGKGGKVQLGMLRYEGNLRYTVDLKREKIVMDDERVHYTYERYGDGIIGKINLPSFYESGEGTSCDIDMREAIRALKKEGNLHGLVIDMRENSGGFLNQAVKVSGLFISSGVIVISKYSQGEMQYLRELDGRIYYNGPLVILTSKASASAAEIVAQALQDYGTALVVGDDRTYGKGTIQFQTVTDATASNFFKVTVGRYYTVSGRSTQIDGVIADILVPTAYYPLMIGERYLEYPLKGDRIPSAYIDPLSDVDPRNRPWFQKNYLPNIQKKLSLWTQMLPALKQNSAVRLERNKDYALFLKAMEQEKRGKGFIRSSQDNWGSVDLQLEESVNIVKDMITIQSTKRAPALQK